MDEQFAINVMSGRKRGVFAAGLRSVCTVASWSYFAAIAGRNLAYDRGWKPTRSVAVPIISLGNITTGGTGKTPIAAFLAERLQAQGVRPAIVSRGYRQLNDQCNDEQLVLKQLLPTVPQVMNRDRVAGARSAISEQGCDLILLDDGFQHRRLHRDLDIVLVDATQPWGFGHLLPRGLLREPLSSLRRADLVLITRCDQVAAAELAQIRGVLATWRGTAASVDLRFRPRRLRAADGEQLPLSRLAGRNCLAFCGIGNPRGFQQTLQSLGVSSEPMIFPDHHHYQPRDIERIVQLADRLQAEILVTTQKDLVKISDTHLGDRPVYAIEIAAEIIAGECLLDEALSRVTHRQKHAA